jgi:hypothetical protein
MGRLNTVNLVKFDMMRQEDILYYHKIMMKNFELETQNAKIWPDKNKYYILIATFDLIIGFNYDNYRTKCDYEKKEVTGPNETTQLRRFLFTNYNFYQDSSDFHCINPNIIFFSTLNKNYSFGFIHKNKNKRGSRFKVKSNHPFTECVANPPLTSFMKYEHNPDYIEEVPKIEGDTQATRSRSWVLNSKRKNRLFLSSISERNSLKYRTKLYLLQTLRNFKVNLINNVNLNLYYDMYFPYALSEIKPLKNPNFQVETKTYKKNQLIYLKDLNRSSIFRGIINRKSSGYDIITMALIQGGRNVLLSNVFHSGLRQASTTSTPTHTHFRPNAPVFQKETFEFQIENKAKTSKNIYSFQNATNLTEFYLNELGLNLGLGNSGKESEESQYWKKEEEEQKKLSRRILSKNLIRVNENYKQNECLELQKEFLFRDKKNLMELALLKGKSNRSE